MSKLPTEQPLGGNDAAPATVNTPLHAAPPANPPPTYSQAAPSQPPLPRRATDSPAKPEIDTASALYEYRGDQGDCEFKAGDQIIIYEYCNAEWAKGRNKRTGSEGLFPSNYVQVVPRQQQAGSYYGNEKQVYQPQPYGGPSYAPPPAANPYNAAAPPMAVANESTGDKQSKGGEMGKKFGKKLGNAAIFGAGATIGGNIVNSIFWADMFNDLLAFSLPCVSLWPRTLLQSSGWQMQLIDFFSFFFPTFLATSIFRMWHEHFVSFLIVYWH